MTDYSAEQLIMGQALVAFGQGTGAIWLHRDSVGAFLTFYEPFMARALEYWEEEGPDALERVRAAGRLAALKAIQAGRTSITAADVTEAAQAVRLASRDAMGNFTRICGS